MNSAYTIGASFVIENLASPEINKLTAQVERLSAVLDEAKISLRELLPPGIITKINSVGLAFDKLAPSAEKAATGMAGAMERADRMFAGLDAAADKASLGIVDAMRRAESGVSKSAAEMKSTLDGMFAGLDTEMTGATGIIVADFGRIVLGAEQSVAAVKALRDEMRMLGASSSIPSLPTLPGMGGGAGGSHRRPGGFHMAPESMNTPMGRVSGHGAAGAAIAGAAIFGDAIYEAAEVEDIVTRILMTGQITPGKHPLTDTEQGRRTFEVIKQGAVDTGFSQKQVGEMMLGTEREFQGLDFGKKMDTLSMLLPAMGAEAHLRETGLKEAGENIVALMHMSGTFDPKGMPEIARAFQFTTMSTPVDLPQFKNALSYSMPVLHGALGMDPSTVMLLTSMMQTAGVTNTKSGTWLRSFFVDAEPSTDVLGPLTKTQAQHNEALNMLGIVGKDGKQDWKINGTDGKVDWNASVIQLAGLLHDGIDAIPAGQRADVLHRAFGTQGSGMATLLEQPTFRDQLPVLAEKMKMYKGGNFTLGEYSEGSTIQQSRIAVQEFQVLMADLGTKLLPTVNAVLQEVSAGLRALPADWEATKKLWGFRVESGLDSLGNAAKTLGGLPGIGVPFRDTSKPLFDPNAVPGSGFVPMSWDGGSTGGVGGAEDTIYRGTLRAFTDFAAGKTVSGGMGGGTGGGGFMNASYGGGGSFGGEGSGAFPGSAAALAGAGGVGGKTGGVNPVLLAMIHRASEISGASLSVYSGYRSPEHNAAVGGAGHSLHMSGFASDLVSPGHSKSDGAFWGRVNRAMAQAAGEMHQPYRWGGNFPGRFARDNDHFDLTPRGPSAAAIGALRRHAGTAPAARSPTHGDSEHHVTRGEVTAMLETLHAAVQRPIHVMMDGKVVAAAAMKRFASDGRFPRSMGGVDASHHYSNGAGTPVVDAA